MNIRSIITFLFSIYALFAIAQIPFEKNGKWGVIDETTNKVILKPQYNFIMVVPNSSSFIVSKYVKTQFEGEKLQYGVVNNIGKEIIPLKADSITQYNSNFLFHTQRYVPVGEDKFRPYPHTNFYNNEGKLLMSQDGEIETIYPGGIIFVSNDIEHRKRSRVLYNSSLNKISSNPIQIEKKGEKYILIKDNNYIIYDTKSFEPILAFNDIDTKYNKLSVQDYIILRDNQKFGYFNLNTGTSVNPSFSNISTFSQKFINENRIILYNSVNENAIAITDEGALINGSVIYDNNYIGNYIFVEQDANGSKELAGSSWLDIRPLSDRDLYTVKNENGWGVLNTNSKELIFPTVMPAPVSEILRHEYAVILTPSLYSLYDKSGKLLFTVDKGKIVDCEDGLIYIDDSWVPSGVYSIENSKWIIPYNKYSTVKRLSGGNFAAKQNDVYQIISPKGQLLNTLNSISEVSNMDGEYFIRVIDKNGKLGLINKSNGAWIVRCLYENDIAWGAGDGNNRRFALTQKTEKGEQVVIMTVAGNKIASRFFPSGTKPGVIRNFGRKYLY